MVKKIAEKLNIDSTKPIVIQSEKNNDLLIWKAPETDFMTGSQLIVHESQEAILFLNGQALDLFGAGRHTLTTENIPLLRKVLHRATGDQSPFHCEVYFINKVNRPGIPWGVGGIGYINPVPEYEFPLSNVGASGTMDLKVDNSRKLLLKLVGTETELTVDAYIQKMKDFVKLQTKDYLPNFIRKNTINIFEIDERLKDISEGLHEDLRSDFADYGVSLEKFLVSTVLKPENDSNYAQMYKYYFDKVMVPKRAKLDQKEAVIRAETDKKVHLEGADARAKGREIEGYTWQEQESFDVARTAAGNEGAGAVTSPMMGAGMGMGMGMPLGGVIGGMAVNAISPVVNATAPQGQGSSVQQPVAGGAGIGNPPPEIGIKNKDAVQSGDSFEDAVKKLKMLRDMDMLPEDEFIAKRNEIMERYGL